jgi:nitroreductase
MGIISNGEGIINVKNSFEGQKEFDFVDFVMSRHSIRDFDSGDLDTKVIETAVSVAIKTPSVCNRQPWRVCSVKGDKIIKLLELQNGNLGFRDSIQNLLVVTGKLSYMRGPIERKQIYIDGGLFSMSLMYALHNYNIGVCSLNWCVNIKEDVQAKKILNLPEDEVIIMYLAIGHKKKTYTIAASPRLPLQEFIRYVEQ